MWIYSAGQKASLILETDGLEKKLADEAKKAMTEGPLKKESIAEDGQPSPPSGEPSVQEIKTFGIDYPVQPSIQLQDLQETKVESSYCLGDRGLNQF